MYLKKIEMRGFKSFADPATIEFTDKINGIVGPNGCGKSNIVDAIKWVLGEQSAKSLRGSNMADVIFAGSDAQKGHNYAEVVLLFDNQDEHLKVTAQEVEIIRRLYKNGESEYYLNKVVCRLKDIVDLMLDSGIGKDSLSIISQGAIASLAQAKPEERRAIFEEASGVAKYKKRKHEALRKLEKTGDHLSRVLDILNELEIQEANLFKQADKAKKYVDFKTQLEQIEVGVLIKEIDTYSDRLDKLSQQLILLSSEQMIKEVSATQLENEIEHLQVDITELDTNIYQLQEELLQVVAKISLLESQKSTIDERQEAWKSQSYEKNKVEAIAQRINELRVQIEHFKKRQDSIDVDIAEKNEIVKSLEEEKRQYANEKDLVFEKFNKTKNRLSVVEHYLTEHTKNQKEITELINNTTNFKDVIDKVSSLISVDATYDKAVSTALGNAMNHIVCTDELAAKKAIKFLTSNRAGRATFLPINIIKPRTIREDDLFVLQNQTGYIDICEALIESDNVYRSIIKNLVGTVVIADNIDNAYEIAKAINFRYKIVTIEGQVVNVGGSLTGGESRHTKENVLVMNREKTTLTEELAQLEIEYSLKQENNERIAHKLTEHNRLLNDQLVQLARVKDDRARQEEYLGVQLAKYEHLSKDAFDLETDIVSTELVDSLFEFNSKREDLILMIKHHRESKLKLMTEKDRLSIEIKSVRMILKDTMQSIRTDEIEKTKIESQLQVRLIRLSEVYELTFESAKDTYMIPDDINQASHEVDRLKQEINRLGIVNLLAIEEHAAIEERTTFLRKQKEDLEKAKHDIEEAICEMDKVMVDKFSTTISQVNETLKVTFSSLFSGGSARLVYSDPNDLLETGIEIEARPPGKSLQNLNLFSGGEKALIALAVLFAIMKVRPVPMCILDEVEAALDQANVERFAKYLRTFADETQFIVITHRPGTMVECDILYGVTMQEAGVSKMISVKLAEAIELVE